MTLSSNRHPALPLRLSMSFSQNRFPLLRDMLYLVMIGPQRAMIHKGEREICASAVSTGRIPLPLTIAVFALAFLLPALPWLSGAVTIPWDAKSQFFPPVQFLAASSSAISLRAFDAVTFAYLFLGGLGIVLFFRDRGWHPGGAIVAAMTFALGGSANARIQHTSEVISLAYLPLTLWLMARALERSSWRAGLAAGLFGG